MQFVPVAAGVGASGDPLHTRQTVAGTSAGSSPEIVVPLWQATCWQSPGICVGATPLAVSSQTPPAAHRPSLPQGGLRGHWPAGGLVPGVTSAQVPSGWPVRAMVHAWQVPVQAVSQQILLPAGPTQLAFAQSVPTVHGWPSGRRVHAARAAPQLVATHVAHAGELGAPRHGPVQLSAPHLNCSV